jgi:hypothetical protein
MLELISRIKTSDLFGTSEETSPEQASYERMGRDEADKKSSLLRALQDMPAATRSTMRVVGDAIKRRLSRGRSLRRSDTHLRRRASSQLVATTNRPKSERGSSAHHSHQHGLRREAMLRGSSPYVLHRTGGTSKHGAHDNLDDVYPKFKVEGSTRTRKPRSTAGTKSKSKLSGTKLRRCPSAEGVFPNKPTSPSLNEQEGSADLDASGRIRGGSSNEREAQLHVKDLIARFSKQIASFTGDMQKHETIKIEGVVYRTIVPRRISKVTASGDHKRRKLPIPESSIQQTQTGNMRTSASRSPPRRF